MNRTEFEKYLIENYKAKVIYPWSKYPNFATFRVDNGKCFAICMDITSDKLGISGYEKISVVNLKCNPFAIGSLTKENGIFPAYHMNKEHWISVMLDNSVEDNKLKFLVDVSHDLTSKKK